MKIPDFLTIDGHTIYLRVHKQVEEGHQTRIRFEIGDKPFTGTFTPGVYEFVGNGVAPPVIDFTLRENNHLDWVDMRRYVGKCFKNWQKLQADFKARIGSFKYVEEDIEPA